MITGEHAVSLADSTESPPSASFEQIYQLNADGVFRFCLSQIDNHATAEDLAHDTFVRALRAYDRAPPDLESVRGWLLAIARNLTTDYFRHRARWRRLLTSEPAVAVSGRDLEEEVVDRSELRRVTRAAQKLGQRDRQLIGLRVAAELSYREIGNVLGISEQVTKVATFRALAKLRHQMEKTS